MSGIAQYFLLSSYPSFLINLHNRIPCTNRQPARGYVNAHNKARGRSGFHVHWGLCSGNMRRRTIWKLKC